MTTLTGGWEIYQKACYPDGALDVQVRETRQAFFSGAVLALALVSCATVQPEDEAIVTLQKLFDEATQQCGEHAVPNFHKGN